MAYLKGMRKTVLAIILAITMPTLLAAGKLPLSALSEYLNSLETMRSDFTQINDDGSLSTGTVYIKRPGKARFQYDGKDSVRVVAGQGAVVIFDPKSNTPPESYPLSRTPLSIILAKRVDLSRARMVVGHEFDGTATMIRAQDPAHPDYGSLDLYFTADPVALRKWVVHDGNGGKTTIILRGISTGMSLPNTLFDTVSGGDRDLR